MSPPVKVTVARKKRVIDQVFLTSVIILVSIIFINFGCAMDWPFLRKSLKRPIGPGIGMFSQFIIMPLVSKANELFFLFNTTSFLLASVNKDNTILRQYWSLNDL